MRLLAVLVADLGARMSPAGAGWEGATLGNHSNARLATGAALRALHAPLSPEPGCPLTPTSREAFLHTQSAVNAAQLSLEDWADQCDRRPHADADADVDADVGASPGDGDDDGDLVADTAVFHEGGLLWSSATARATRAVSRYAARCLVPSSAFHEEEPDEGRDRSTPPGGGGEKASTGERRRARALAAAVRAEAAAGIASLGSRAGAGGESPGGESPTLFIGGNPLDDDVPIAASEWSVAPDGFLRRSSAAGEAVEASGRDVPAAARLLRLGPPAATRRGDSPPGDVYLLSLRVGACTLAVSLRVARCPPLTDEAGWRDLRSALRNASAPRLRELHDCLAASGGGRLYGTNGTTNDSKAAAAAGHPPDHAAGHRYLYVDDATLAVRASPGGVLERPVLSADILATVSSARREMEALETESTYDEISDGDAVCRTHELCVRSGADAWVVGKRASASGTGKRTRDRRLWVVLDRAGDTLLDASAAIGAFCDEHFDGIFS